MAFRKVVLVELNEVPWRVLDDHVRSRPCSTLAAMLRRSFLYETVAADRGHLSPWRTWPSLHRGVNDETHLIGDLGQDRTKADHLYPPIWQLLHEHGIPVGVCGSLHSFPPPDDVAAYSFYLPDAFATSDRAHPSVLSKFQAFNLAMARDSARNVDTSIPVKPAIEVVARTRALGIRPATYRAVAAQLLSEQRHRWRSTRRRTFQAVLAFDVFDSLLRRTKPAFSTFFTNHVASAMHRYWAATYPGDYEHLRLGQDWVDRYRDEVPWAMTQADRMLGRLLRFADRNPEYQIWMASSMGQAPTIARALETAVYLKDVRAFMRRLGLPDDGWQVRPAMLPQTNVMVREDLREPLAARLRRFRIGKQPLRFRETDTGFFAMDFGQANMHARPKPVRYEGSRYPLAEFGLEAVEIEDRSDTTAYHVPEGILAVYDPVASSPEQDRRRVSALSVAPALMRRFGARPPDYMVSDEELAPVLV